MNLNYTDEIIVSPDGIPCKVLDTESIDFKDGCIGRKAKETLVLKAKGGEKIDTINSQGLVEATYITKPGDAIFYNSETDKYVPRDSNGNSWKFDNITDYGYEITFGLHSINFNDAIKIKSTKLAYLLPRAITLPTCIKDAWGEGDHQFLYSGATLKKDIESGKVTGIEEEAFNNTWEITQDIIEELSHKK